MAEHFLKTWPREFAQVAKGIKPFEVRKNDRGFAAGDVLVLQEYDPERGYTGLVQSVCVTSVLDGLPADDPAYWGISEGYCAMGIVKLSFIFYDRGLLEYPPKCSVEPRIAGCPFDLVFNYGLCS